MADGRDFYEILGVGRAATPDEIQRAYRQLARRLHPDVNKDPTAEDQFKDVSEAYDVLSDPDTRRRYDAFGPDFRRVPDDVTPEDFARARAGAAGRGDGMRFTSSFGDEGIDLDEIFGGMFGGSGFRSAGFGTGGFGGARREWGTVPGADQEAELVLSVEDAYRGGHRTITLSGPDGSRTFEVDVPPGVVDGQRIRLRGQGGQGSGGASPGDLFFVVRIKPDARFRVEGRDIFVQLPLTPWEAALGASVAVDTPDGEAKVRVPAGTSSGKRLRLRGRGMPNRRSTPGDLLAEVRIMVPSKLTDAERHLFEELAAASTFDPRRQR
ncbi:MAG: DnaJ C-terminal domain-containing protein [Acidimicrobiia bacterium]